MAALGRFLKVTILGGLIFLVPAVLIIAVLQRAMQLAKRLATPIAALFPEGSVAGIAIATILAALILLLIAFAAGLLARTSIGRRLTHWFEASVLGAIPQYRMVKSMAEGLAQVETGAGMQPVLLRTDEGWQLGYRIEEMAGGWVAVFLPAAPTPMSGNVMYVTADRVLPLAISMAEAMRIVKRIGIGSGAAFSGVDLGK
jgi:uncharacterized membrane protein